MAHPLLLVHRQRQSTMWSESSWLAPSWRHESAVTWRPHDVMRAPSGGAPMTSWGIVRSGEAFGQFSKPDWVSTVMSFEYVDNWLPKWNFVNLTQQKVKVKLCYTLSSSQNKCSNLFLSKRYDNIVRMNVLGMSVDVPPWTLMWYLTYLCLLTYNYNNSPIRPPTH